MFGLFTIHHCVGRIYNFFATILKKFLFVIRTLPWHLVKNFQSRQSYLLFKLCHTIKSGKIFNWWSSCINLRSKWITKYKEKFLTHTNPNWFFWSAFLQVVSPCVWTNWAVCCGHQHNVLTLIPASNGLWDCLT